MITSTLLQLMADFSGDPDQTRYSSTKYYSNLNLAQQQFALDTKALWKDKSWSHAASDADEDLPTDFMWENWVTYAGKPLTPISRYRLTQDYGDDWTAVTATAPTHYIIDPEQAVKEIVLFPIPTEAKTLVMRYFPFPADVSAGTDVILNSSSLMAQFHMAVAAFGAWLNISFEEQTPALAEKKRELMKIYNDGVTKAVDTFKNTASEPLRIRPKC